MMPGFFARKYSIIEDWMGKFSSVFKPVFVDIRVFLTTGVSSSSSVISLISLVRRRFRIALKKE